MKIIVLQVFGAVAPKYGMNIMASGKKPEDFGIVIQKGLNRKVLSYPTTRRHTRLTRRVVAAHLRFREGKLKAPAAGLHRRLAMFVPIMRCKMD